MRGMSGRLPQRFSKLPAYTDTFLAMSMASFFFLQCKCLSSSSPAFFLFFFFNHLFLSRLSFSSPVSCLVHLKQVFARHWAFSQPSGRWSFGNCPEVRGQSRMLSREIRFSSRVTVYLFVLLLFFIWLDM